MAQILGTVLSPGVKDAYDLMKRHICYAFKCKKNVNTLKERVEALKGEQERLKHSVEDERRNGKQIMRDVDEWLGQVGVIVEKEGKELVLASERAEMKCFFGFCPNLKTRYRVSRKAEKKAKELSKLLEKRQPFSRIAYDAPLQCMEALSTGDYKALESRMEVSEDIIKVLTTDGVSMVGVHGIGGVGKTTLAKEILRQVKEQKLFDEVVMATINKDVNVKDIQAEIGEALGLKFDGVESVKVRASRLFGRLESGKEKKVLIILDDLWKKLDLVEVGIPSKNQLSGCKIFLTSRDLNVLSNEMDCQKNFEVGCLPEKEAWDLFQKMANNSFEQHDLRSTAIEVAKMCSGLPIAIVTVARTLKDKSLPEWKDALLKLKMPFDPSMGLTPMQATIYSTLEFSYKELGSELQSTFLLCSQMGYNATTGDLLKYGIGLGLFSNVSTLEEAQNRVYSSVQRLRELCLFLEGGTNKELVMHDVVRDVGRWIAARDDDVLVVSDENKKKEWSAADKLKTCTRIWIFGSVDEVPEEMDCPKLVLAHGDGKDGSLKVPDNLFRGLHKLKVLSFTSFTFSSLPSSLCWLENLKTLCFHQSMELEGVSIIGKLTKLEVLSFAESNITHLPVEIGQLSKLRLLDLSGCYKLEMIPPNILSRLYQLEELYMGNSFDRWTVEGQESQDTASLGELKQLVSLTNLEISILDARLVSEDIFPEKLCRYKIFIGSIEDWNKKFETLTKMKLKLNASLQIEKGLMRLVKKSEDLYLDGLEGVKNFVYDLDNDGFPKLKHLHLCNSPEVQYFADMTKVAPSVAFSVLESLYLEELFSLEKIYQSRLTGQCFFSKLRIINVKSCHRLTHLFLFLVAQGLSQLQKIKIDYCASLETVVAEASEAYINSCESTNVIEFSQLESLWLTKLPKLTSFCSDANTNGLSRRATNLWETNVNEDVKISMSFLNHKILLPNLKIMNLSWIDNMETLWHGQLPPIKNSFQNLTNLTVRHCHRLKYVFSYSLIKCLGKLQRLTLDDCETLEEVILVEEESGEEQLRSSKAVLLPKLQSIKISCLPELKRFCKGYLVECPLLTRLWIWQCPQLKTFVSQECEQVRLDVEKNDQTAKLRKPLFDEMVVFPSLESINLLRMISIEKIWHNQLAPGSFCKLKNLNIYGCEKLADIFPPILILLERFQKLESLRVSLCDCVEEIFAVEGTNKAEHISFQLKLLDLNRLPILRHIWTEDSSRLFTFPNLCQVQIENCSSLRNVFPRPIAENLLELEELTVRSSRVDEIVAMAENGEEAEVHPLMWPKLKKLDIPDPFSFLQKVLNINSNLEELGFDGTSPSQILKDHVHFSKLKVVNLHHFMDEWAAGGIPFGFLQKLPNLEKLSVRNSSFRELFSCDGVVADSRVLTCLKHLSLFSLSSLRHIWEQNDFILASPLLQIIETLEVRLCGSLVTLAPSSASFKNLTTLAVRGCSRLLSLVTASTAKSLGQLIKFEIRDCKMMTEIIDREGDEADNIIFTKLQCLKIVGLESLTSFCSGDHTFSFPSLEEMIVVNFPKMRVFCAGRISTPKLHEVYLGVNKRWEGNLNSTIQKLYIEKVGFDGMYDLKLSEFPELREVWHGPLPGKLFSSLRSLVVDDCSFFRGNCNSLEEVLHVELLRRLQALCLSDLPRLLNLWNKNSPIVLELKCLTRLEIHNCPSLQNLFTPSMAACLVRLKEIEIRNCIALEEIYTEEKAGEATTDQTNEVNSNSCDATNVIEFSQLESLSLSELPKLTSFCSDANPNGLSGKATNLLETNINKDVKVSMTLLNHKILLPNLKIMDLSWIDNMETLWHGQLPPIKNSFQNLTDLTVGHCHRLKYVFSYSLIKCLGQLERLTLDDCETLEEVILVEEESGEGQLRSSKAVLLPKLQFINIKNLPELKRFCKDYRVECPLLTRLSIRECPQLKTFVSQECEQVRLDVEKNDQTAKLRKPLFDEMVVFPRLENLWLRRLISVEKIWHNQLAPGSFCKLKNLNIDGCEKLADIFPPTLILLERFQKLESLLVSSCDFVEEIFGVEGSNKAEHISFQLRHLDLRWLPKLRHIWTEDSSRLFTFPNLCQVKIEDCSSLRNVFPRPIAENLLELEELMVRSSRVDEIVAMAENGEEAEVHPLMWPKLKKLDIPDPFSFLQKVLNINSNLEELGFDGTSPSQILKDHVHFSKLKVVNLHHFMDEWAAGGIPFGFLQKLPNLEKLSVINSSFREMFSCDGVVADSRVLSCLKHLSLFSLHSLRHIWEQNDFILSSPLLQNIETLRVEKCGSLVTLAPSSASFKNLTTLAVSGCRRLLSLVTASTAKSLGQLIRFEIRDCKMMTEIIDREGDEADNIIFTKLQGLKIVGLESLTSFCSGDHTFSFPSLEEMIVVNFPKMRVFCAGRISTPKLHEVYLGVNKRWEGNLNSTIQKLYIEKVGFDGMHALKLSEFPELKEVWHGPLPGKVFSKLGTLVVDNCSFFSRAVPSNLLPSLGNLRQLCVKNCDSLEEVFDLERLNAHEDHVELLPKLNELQLSDLPRLQHICNKNSQGFFESQRLKKLIIHNCSSLRRVFTISIAVSLVKLQTFEIRNCEMLEEIFTTEKADESERDKATIFPLLHTLILECLPNLVNITAGNGSQLEFPSLTGISIEKCPNMKPFFSHLLRGLLSEVVHEGPNLESKSNKVAFPCLTNLRLEWYDTLAEIMHGLVADECFAKLEVLELINLPNDHIVSLFYFLQRFPNIHELVLSNAHFEEIVTHDEATGEDQHAKLVANLRSLKLSELSKLVRLTKEDTLLCSVFQRLETLKVVKCSIMEILVPSFVSFQLLRNLEVSECNGLLCLITSAAAGSLMLLKRLTVRKCRTIEQIIPNEENLAGKTVTFSKLEELELHCLPSLMSFSFWNCALIFPSLKEVFMSECPMLKLFSQGAVYTPELIRVYVEEGKGKSCWEGSLNATIQKIFIEMHEDQALPMSNQAESSKQPNLNAEDAPQQNSRTCDVPEGQTRKAIHVNENPDAVEELFIDIGATNTITTKQQSLEAKEDPTLNQNSPTPMDIKDDIVLHPQVDPYATDEDKPIPPAATEVASLSFSTSTTKTAYFQMGESISTSEDSHVTKNPDFWKDLFPEIEPTKNIRAEEHAANGSLVELVKTEMAMSYLISNDQDQAMEQSVHQSSRTQPNIHHIEADEPREIKTFQVSEGSTSDELHTSKNLNESNSLDIVEEGIITGSFVEPEMTQIASTRQVFHFTVDDKEATPDQGARVASGVVTPLPASELSHLSQENYLKCIRTPDDNFMDSSFAQNAIELFEWKINADRDHPRVYFLAELVADLKQLHTSEENLSLGANPPMRTNDHKNTLGKGIEELNEVHEKIQEYEKVLDDLKKQRQKLLQRRTSLFKRKKLIEAVKIDLCEARSFDNFHTTNTNYEYQL